jgi:threonine/homoserine/homoserine lactone efflux protein
VLPASHLLAFAGVSAVLIVIPGPSVLFTISRALTAGRGTALLNVIGNSAGLVVQIVAVAFGIGELVEQSAQVFTVVKLVGALYIVFLGVQAIRHRDSLARAVSQRSVPITPRRALRDGLVVGVMNPKSIAFLVLVLPRFTAPSYGPVPLQMLELGALFPLIAMVLDSLWALAAGTASHWLSRSPRRLAAIGGAGGVVMIGLGVSLAATGRKD